MASTFLKRVSFARSSLSASWLRTTRLSNAKVFVVPSRSIATISHRVHRNGNGFNPLYIGGSMLAIGYLGVSFADEKCSTGSQRGFEFEERFKKYASQEVNGELFMTQDDFIRSLLPVGVSFIAKTDPSTPAKKDKNDPRQWLTSLADSKEQGLISFNSYVFFMTLASTPASHFEIAFRLFDTNKSGTIDENEFRDVIKSVTANKIRLLRNTPLPASYQQHRSPMMKYLFGADGKKQLKLADFSTFIQKLQEAILKIEFDHFDADSSGLLSPEEFALGLVAYASSSALPTYKKRAHAVTGGGVDFEQFKSFHRLLDHIEEFETATELHRINGGIMDQVSFAHIASAVCGAKLPSTVVSILFRVFDNNGDNILDPPEFIQLMKARYSREPIVPGWAGFKACMKQDSV